MSEKKQKFNEVEKEKIIEISAEPPCGTPETAYEMLTSYGTYEIQPTANTENIFPTIAQGYPKNTKPSGRRFHKSEK